MIYYAEDDIGIRELVVYALKNTGLDAIGFENGKALLEALSEKLPELILLDIMMPGDDGIEILKKIRSSPETSTIPVIMVTAKSTEYDKIIGLDGGADDYISKPFGIMEMVSRIKAVLRRSPSSSVCEIYTRGPICLDLRSHTVSVNSENISLTLKEFELLRMLMASSGTVLTRDLILEKIWGYDFDGETRTVDVHIRTLRAKLKDSGELIETIRGVGYRIK